jgi:hypothetical protein
MHPALPGSLFCVFEAKLETFAQEISLHGVISLVNGKAVLLTSTCCSITGQERRGLHGRASYGSYQTQSETKDGDPI